MISRKILRFISSSKRVLQNLTFSFLRVIARLILNFKVRDATFTIFSNDCYGGEIYRAFGIPYNTPFIGLMLMAPCYMKFLANPTHYLTTSLSFSEVSKYFEMNDFRAQRGYYPLGVVDDIEIHFLHYASKVEAEEKWVRRSRRVNWDRVLLKFSMDKDFATVEHLKFFEELPFCKVCFSREHYDNSSVNVRVPKYDHDATKTFNSSLLVFNLIGWLDRGQRAFVTVSDRLNGFLLYVLLRH